MVSRRVPFRRRALSIELSGGRIRVPAVKHTETKLPHRVIGLIHGAARVPTQREAWIGPLTGVRKCRAVIPPTS